MVTVLPDLLYWAPDGAAVPSSGPPPREVPTLDLCLHAEGKAAKYAIPHYAPQAVGAAFGPLGLQPLLHFARGLEVALDAGAVALTTPKGDKAYRLNSLVFLGGYLIAKRGWSANQVAKLFGADADAKYICSWSRREDPDSERVMTVRDCWDGIDLAMARSWMDVSCLEDDEKLRAAVSRHNIRAIVYDAVWLVPGLVMVASDPTTVAYDPNPATCKYLVPQGKEVIASNECHTASMDSMATPSTAAADSGEINEDDCPLNRATLCSVDTVCKEYNENYEDQLPTDLSQAPSSYAGFLTQSAVGLIVRVNFDNEDGMPGRSYGADTFEPFGVKQVKICVVDTGGGLPLPKDVKSMLEACEHFTPAVTETPAVFVHCKGGFGRSMIMAICLLIYRFDVPGSAMLGWARIVRPGAVTTRKQELFLKGLKGKNDVLKYARMPIFVASEDTGSSKVSCAGGCSLQ